MQSKGKRTQKANGTHATAQPQLVRLFRDQVELKLDLEAMDKGYDQLRLHEITRGMPHAIAEIIYKCVRYHKLRDPNDLVKIAAWAELEFVYWHSHDSC